MQEEPLDDIRKRLEQELSDLQNEALNAQDSEAPVELDQASVGRLSRVDAIQSQCVALTIKRNRDQRIAGIMLALQRREAGTYGICLQCKKPIPQPRLAMDAAAARCVQCA